MAARRKLTGSTAYKSGLDWAALILRLVFGASMLIGHGWNKLMKFFGDGPITFSDPLGVGIMPSLIMATFAEVFCAVLLIVGLFTRLATIPLIITMLTALIFVHLNDPFAKMEKAILFLGAFLVIFLIGSGKYSLDHYLRK